MSKRLNRRVLLEGIAIVCNPTLWRRYTTSHAVADFLDNWVLSMSEPSTASRLLRWILYVGGGLLALVLLVIFLVPRLFSDAQLKALVIPPMEEATGRTVAIDGIDLRMLPSPAVRVSNFSLANAEGFSDQPFVAGEELNVEVALFPLFTGTIEPTAVALVAPTVRYEIAEDGTTNIDDLGGAAEDTQTTPDEATSGPAIGVSDFRMTTAHLVYADRSTGQWVDVTFNSQLSAVPTDAGAIDSQGTLSIASVQAVLPDVSDDTLAVQNATLTYDVLAALQNGRIDLRSLQLDTPPLGLQSSGTIDRLNTTPTVDLSLETTKTDLANLASFVPADVMAGIAPRGSIQLQLQMNGPLPDSTGTGDIALDGSGRLAGVGIDYEGTAFLRDLKADLTLSLDEAALQNINGELLGERLSGQVAVRDLMDAATLDGHLTGAADLERLSGLATTDDETESTMDVQGQATYDVRFSGTASDPSTLRLRGPITVSDLRYATTPATFREPLTIPEATFELTGTGLRADRFPMQSGEQTMALAFTAQNLLPADRAFADSNPAFALDFTFTSDRLDLVALLPEADASEIGYSDVFTAQLSGSTIDGRSPEEVAQAMYGDTELPAFAMNGRVEIGTLLNEPQRFDDLSMDVRLRNRRLDVQNLTAQTYGGTLAGSITLDQSAAAASAYVRPTHESVLMATAESAVAPPSVHAFPMPDSPTALSYDFALQDAQASAFLSDWTQLGGIVNGTLDLDISGNSPLQPGFLPIAEALTARGNSIVVRGGFAENFGLAQALVDRLGISIPSFAQFQRLGGSFQIRDGALQLSEWALDNRLLKEGRLGGRLGLGGSVDLQVTGQMPLSMVGASNLGQGSAINRILNALGDDDGHVPLQLGVGGTMSDPQVQVDTDAFQNALQELMPDAGQRLRNLFDGDGR